MAAAQYSGDGLPDEKVSSIDLDIPRRSFVSDDTESQLLTGLKRSARPASRWRSLRLVLACVAGQLVFIAIYTVILLKVTDMRTCKAGPSDVISSPANEAIHWEAKFLDTRLKQENEYVGGPTPEADKAWNDLIDLSNIKVPNEDLARIGKSSIPVPDEPDKSWATLGVIHELHCLGRLRMSIYMDHYYPDFTEEDKRLNRAHSEHCIDYLRQAAMCHGDTSLTTYYWSDDDIYPVADFNSPKACVNWDALAEWQRERVWDPMQPGYLKHPKLGVPFPDGDGTLIGVKPHQMNNSKTHDTNSTGHDHHQRANLMSSQ